MSELLERAAAFIAPLEAFEPCAKWDVNAMRLGYGSDTVYDPHIDGERKVKIGDTTTREDASRDLAYRLRGFETVCERQVGANWRGLALDDQISLLSVCYNYGHLPHAVAAAAQSSNANAIARAIYALRHDNAGINWERRRREARNVADLPEFVVEHVA